MFSFKSLYIRCSWSHSSGRGWKSRKKERAVGGVWGAQSFSAVKAGEVRYCEEVQENGACGRKPGGKHFENERPTWQRSQKRSAPESSWVGRFMGTRAESSGFWNLQLSFYCKDSWVVFLFVCSFSLATIFDILVNDQTAKLLLHGSKDLPRRIFMLLKDKWFVIKIIQVHCSTHCSLNFFLLFFKVHFKATLFSVWWQFFKKIFSGFLET